MHTTTVAIDLGGTHVRAAVIGDDGRLLTGHRQPTPTDEPTPSFIPHMIKEVVADTNDVPAPRLAVIGVPGVVNHETEELVVAPNLPREWTPYLNADWLADNIGMDVSLANDADLAAVGEAVYGAGSGFRDVVYVTISTGVGAGLVVGGKLVRGTHSGGEIGHTIVDIEAAAEGRPATVELIGSGTAIEREVAAAGIEAKGPALAALVRCGDEPATSIWNRGIGAVGIGIANLAWMVAPQVVVIGGGVGRNHDLVAPIVSARLEQHGPRDVGPIEVATAALGDDAALIGAAAWSAAVGRG